MSSAYSPYGGPPTQRCQRCGMPLPPNVVTCMNCGAYNSLAQPGGSTGQGQPLWGGTPQQSSYEGGQSGPQWGLAPNSPSQNNQWAPPATFPQNNTYGTPYTPLPTSSANNFYGMPGQGQQSNFSNYYAPPQQNAFYSAQSVTYPGYSPDSLNGYAPPGFDRPPQKKRGPKVGLIVGIVVLVLILISGAFAGYSYLNNHNQNGTASNATPTRLSTPSIKPLFSDSFNNNSTGWDLSSSPGKFLVKVGGGSMVLEDDDNKLLWEILPGKRFSDFQLDVNVALSKGDPNNGYGVYIRGGSSQESEMGTYYRFELYGDGTYAIYKGSLDTAGHTQSTKVRDYTANNAIAKAVQVNHITIIAKGPTMTLMVNGQTLYTYTDNTYKDGSVALFVSNVPNLKPGAQATFTNLAVFPAS